MAECHYKEYEEKEKEMRQTEQRWLGCSCSDAAAERVSGNEYVLEMRICT